MNMQMISNALLEIFYIIVGLLMLNTAIDTLKDQKHKTRIGTAIFWTILSIIFIAGGAIPPVVVGALLLVIGVLTASKQVNIGNLKMPNVDFAEMQAKKLKNKIFFTFNCNSSWIFSYCTIYKFIRNCCHRYSFCGGL